MKDKILKAKLEKCVKILQQLEATKEKETSPTINKHFKGKN